MPQPPSELSVMWCGTAGLILQAEETIAFDPFCGISPDAPSGTLPYAAQFQSVRHVFVTHGHFDHIYHIPQLYSAVPATVYCTHTPAKTLLHHGLPEKSICEITPEWNIQIGTFHITAWHSRHCRFDLPLIAKTVCQTRFFRDPAHLLRLLRLNLSYREHKETLFYEVTRGTHRIQIMGSMNLDDHTPYPTGADILVLPLQGRSDLDTYALPLVARLQPRLVLLDHYDDSFAPMSSQIDVSGFIHNVESALHIPCRPMVQGQPIYFNQEENGTWNRRQKENGEIAAMDAGYVTFPACSPSWRT